MRTIRQQLRALRLQERVELRPGDRQTRRDARRRWARRRRRIGRHRRRREPHVPLRRRRRPGRVDDEPRRRRVLQYPPRRRGRLPVEHERHLDRRLRIAVRAANLGHLRRVAVDGVVHGRRWRRQRRRRAPRPALEPLQRRHPRRAAAAGPEARLLPLHARRHGRGGGAGEGGGGGGLPLGEAREEHAQRAAREAAVLLGERLVLLDRLPLLVVVRRHGTPALGAGRGPRQRGRRGRGDEPGERGRVLAGEGA